MVEIYFAKVRPSAKIPSKRAEDAGYDLYACFEEPYLIIEPHQTVKVPIGIASFFPQEYCMVLRERGSTGTMGIGQRAGVIDSGYRNEWLVPITNHNLDPIIIIKDEYKMSAEYEAKRSERSFIEYAYTKAISQALLIPVPKTDVIEISYDELLQNKSERMLDGFGSTNKK